MNLLILHQNYPGQFERLARALAEREGWTVVGVGQGDRVAERIKPARYYSYTALTAAPEAIFPPLRQFEQEVRRGRSVAEVLWRLRQRGFQPDIVIAHSGWGE